MNNSLVSIIIPAFNAEDYIDRAVSSCLNQNYPNIEILVVDDGSKDNTADIVNRINSEKIKLICKENGGVSSARNLGIENATGDYCIFLDADDWIEENTVEEYMKMADKDILVSSSTNYVTGKEGNYRYQFNTYPHSSLKSSAIELIENVDENICGMRSACMKLFSLKVIQENGLRFALDIHHIEDGLFVYEYLHYVNTVVYIDKPLWNIQREEVSITNSSFNPKKMTAITAIERMRDGFENNEKTAVALTNYLLGTCRWAIMDALYSRNKEYRRYVEILKKKMSLAMKSSFYKPKSFYDKATFVFFSSVPFEIQYFLLNTYHLIRYGS